MKVLALERGTGALALTGLRASDPEISKAFCQESEQLVGWISVGTPKSRSAPRGADPIDEIYSDF